MSSTHRQTILITGVSGFVGSHVAKAFLDQGWNVVGTVRSTQKGDALLSLPAFSKAYEEKRIRYTIIEDIATSDFRQALTGVDALAHTASPFHFGGKTFSDYAEPAINGTSNVLKAAKEFSQIKSVVVTSSFVSIVNLEPAHTQSHKVYNEQDWLPIEYEAADGDRDSRVWYCASKKLAEKKAWEIKESGASWTLATVCPPMIFGPVIHTHDLNRLNESSGQAYKLLSGQTDGKVPSACFPAFCDVRDVAEAHLQSILKQASGRYLVASGEYDNQLMVDFIRDRFPDNAQRVPIGKPGTGVKAEEVYRLDASKVMKTFGIKPKTFDQCFGDTIAQYIELEKTVKQS